MATNAAKELLELLESWKPKEGASNVTVLIQRGGSSQFSEKLWRNQLRAVGLLIEIEAFIDARGERELHSVFIRDLRRLIFVPEHGWKQVRLDVEPGTRSVLHLIAQLMDVSAPRTLHLDAAELEALQDALHECLEILDPVTIANDKGLQYLREVLRRIQEAVKGGNIDFTLVRDQAYAAIGLALLNHEAVPSEKRKRFFERLFSVIVPFGTGTATGASGNVVGAALTNFLQIGS